MNTLTSKFDKLHHHKGFSSYQWFDWFLDDCLATFGVRIKNPPPDEVRPVLFELGQLYAKEVIANEPFRDLLGVVYQELASKGQQQHLGQFFTPWCVAYMMGQMTYSSIEPKPSGELTTIIDPAVGSGVMLLAFARNVFNDDAQKLAHCSFTGVDLDGVCARMAPLQMLANGLIHQVPFGELVFYRGNSLHDLDQLEVVIHAVRRRNETKDVPVSQAIKPEVEAQNVPVSPELSFELQPTELPVLPAKHPARIRAIRHAAKAQRKDQLGLFDFDEEIAS